jgi:dTDP-4-amino-4,6-dideoxygalactose transaminase
VTGFSGKRLKITEPWFDGTEGVSVGAVLASGQLIQAARIAEFEQMFAAEVGCRDAIMVSSGTAALHLAMLASGIGPGDAVAVPDFTFVATANTVALTGATPVFVDVSLDTYNMDAVSLRQSAERMEHRRRHGGPALRMVVPVHQFGLPAEMDEIAEVARDHGLFIIEDAACALGSRYRGRAVGRWGVASCFSFHPRKVLTTGEGGAIVTNDTKFAERLRALRAHGFSSQLGRPDLIAKGLNYRMTEMQAALGISQMRKLPEILHRRRSLAELMHRQLAGISWFRRPVIPLHLTPNWQSYVGVLDQAADRDRVIERIAACGIETRPGATAIHLLQAYQASTMSGGDCCSVSEMLDAKTLALPLHPGMDEADVVRIATELRAVGSS